MLPAGMSFSHLCRRSAGATPLWQDSVGHEPKDDGMHTAWYAIRLIHGIKSSVWLFVLF